MRIWLSGFAAILVLLGHSPEARACGGFFCSNLPIDQSAEHIAFGVTADASGNTTVEAHVEIAYSGQARNFAWVVPVHARPTLDIGSPALFAWLDSRTQPSFNLEFEGNGQCRIFAYEDGVAGGAADAGSAPSGVTVLEQEDIGPYVATILTANDAGELTNWLRTNDYDLTDAGAAALEPYVGQGYFFVALRLQANRTTGDLKPIVLKMTDTQPCIPIRLTAIAAQENMPIRAYFFAQGRGVPTNFLHVIINEAAIDWLNYGSNYNQVATAAIREAGGHAFLTEFAGPTSQLTQGLPLYTPGQYDTSTLRSLSDPAAFMQALISGNYPRPGLLPLLERFIPMPASLQGSVSEAQFYNNLSAYSQAIADDPGRDPFDPVGLADAIETELIAPMRNAQAMIDASTYTTRLHTTMSPADMTVDPEFDFNTDLPDVSNLHTAKASCLSTDPNGPVQITLADGRSITQRPGSVPNVPAAGIVEELGPRGQPREIANNVRVGGRTTGCTCGQSDMSMGLVLLLSLLGARRLRRA